MLDIKLLREEEGIRQIEEELDKRNLGELKMNLPKLIKLDEKIRKLIQQSEELRQERNKSSDLIAQATDEERPKLIKQGKKIGQQIKKIEEKLKNYKADLEQQFSHYPNFTDPRVPLGGEDQNITLKEDGTKKEFGFEPLGHAELFEKMGWLDKEQAANLSGARFSYLIGDLVKLEFTFFHWLMDWLIENEDFTPVLPPLIVKEQAMFGAGNFPTGREDVFQVENPTGNENLYLSGTAEIQLASLRANQIINNLDKPLRYCAFSTNFRREAGAAGKDTQGITRQHQFNKLEMFIYAKPEDSEDELQKLVTREDKIIEALGLPYRTLLLASQDNPGKFSITYDHEIWLPGEKAWREVQSASNALDYQARRLNIRYRTGEKQTDYVHTLNGTAAAERFLIAIIENYQQEDGTVMLPEVLHSYYHGEPVLKPVN
ncbi:serine--tRNA ligase [Patescibacteria group bacterium]